MKALIAAATLSACVMASSAGFCEPRLLARNQFATYHACLYDAWIRNWCHWHDVEYEQCVISYRGGRYVNDSPLYSDDYCYAVARGVPPR
jgi:hypothetical protein